jgi:hypothetical protein
MPDLLHPNLAGAEAWAQAIEATLARLMGDKPIVDAKASHCTILFSRRPLQLGVSLKNFARRPQRQMLSPK